MPAVYQWLTRAAGAKAKLLRANVQILGVKLPPLMLKIVKCCVFYKFCSFWNGVMLVTISSHLKCVL